jgi:hypothetical protein
LKGPPKFTQLWIFGLKIYHLATLIGKRKQSKPETKETANLSNLALIFSIAHLRSETINIYIMINMAKYLIVLADLTLDREFESLRVSENGLLAFVTLEEL